MPPLISHPALKPNAPGSLFSQLEVGEKSKDVKYRLACKAGVLKTLYGCSDVRALVEQTPLAHGSESTLQGWRGLLQNLGIRAAVATQPSVGGQGHVNCLCKGGNHAVGRCACASVPGASATHATTRAMLVKCKNHDKTEHKLLTE
eukprot:3820344-Pleurochrysis_carterae.AAC.1